MQHSPTAAALAARFDPFTDPYLADPYPYYAEARAAAPVFFSAELDYWVVTRYRDVLEIFKNPADYSAANALAPIASVCPAAAQVLAAGGFRPVPTLTNNDPPAHTRVRRLANDAFTPRRVAAMEGYIRLLTTRFIDTRFASGAADLVRDLAWELPALVIFRVLGVPDKDVARIKSGAESRLLFTWGRPAPESQVRLAEGMAAFWRYAEALVEARAREPGDDFTSDLLLARDGEVPVLSTQEVATVVYGLLLAGHETTTSLLANACRRLLADRAAWGALYRDPALIPNAVEETLRYDSSVIAWRRRTTRAVLIGDAPVPADANLLLLIGSANRDPAVFQDPERFDIRRANAREHLSFGHGPHYCLGAPLARLEARVVLEELNARLPQLRLVPDQPLRYQPNVAFRGPLSLRVTWPT